MKNWLVIVVTIIIIAGFAWASMDKTPPANDAPGTPSATSDDPHAGLDMGQPVKKITAFKGDKEAVLFKLDGVNITRGTLNTNINKMIMGVQIDEETLDDDGRMRLAVAELENMLWRKITTREMGERGLDLSTPVVTDEEIEEALQEKAVGFGGMDKMEEALEQMHPGSGLEAMRRLLRKELTDSGKMTLDEALYQDITRDVTLTDEEIASLNGDKQYLADATDGYQWASISMADAVDQEDLLERKKTLVFDNWVAEAHSEIVGESLEWVDEQFKTFFAENDLLEMLGAAAESRQQHAMMPAPHGAMPGMAGGMSMGGHGGMGGMGGMGMGGMTMPPGHPPMPGPEGPGADSGEEGESAE